MRGTERTWQVNKINVRSTMWAGPRGGAAFTSACMTLLAHYNGPVWPIRAMGNGPFICEAFPAAQLCQWGIPYTGYNGLNVLAQSKRQSILQRIVEVKMLSIGEDPYRKCLGSADALDAVLCCFSAAAVALDRLAFPPCERYRSEGHIAVFR